MRNRYFKPLLFLAGLLLASCSGTQTSSSFTTSEYIGPDRTVTLYAINDFHGQLPADSESTDERYYQAGIVRLGGFMKAMGKEDNTMVLCTGDLWQGSLESNYNRGKLLTDVMNEIEFDCFTLGNHEFDWGADYIRENRTRKDPDTGYQTPFLAANIYNYDIDSRTTKDYADLGDTYVIREMENGLRVGIVGGIGYNQITSITSTFADEFDFLRPCAKQYDSPTGKSRSLYQMLSDDLRAQGCDVVILDHHGGQDELLRQGLTDVSDVSGKRYYDGIFCAHTHYREKTSENGVPFVQGSCNGRAYSTFSLTVAGDGSGEVTCTSYDNPYSKTIDESYDDEGIAKIVNAYAAETAEVGQEVLTTLEGSWSESEEVPNLVCESVAKICEQENVDVDIVICNVARANLYEGELTYSDLFNAIPFDNELYVFEAYGTDIINRADGNYCYRIREEAFSDDGKYKAAVIDYMAVHRSSARMYDYFPSADFANATILEQDGEIIRYRDCTAANLRSKDSFSSSDYASNLNRYNGAILTSAVTF